MKISVITVCYNAVATIESSILSLINQDYRDFEYIVIDGGSSDGTVDIVNRYLPHISYFISEPDLGIYDALNKGIKQAAGDVIGVLHANDCYGSNRVLSKVAEIITNRNVDAVYGDLVFYNTKGKVVRKWKSRPATKLLLELGWMPPHPTLFIKKNFFYRYGNYRLDFGTAADYELILRLFYRHKIKSYYVNAVFVKMLTGGLSNKSILSHVRGNINDLKAMKMHGLRASFIAVLFKPLQKLIQYL